MKIAVDSKITFYENNDVFINLDNMSNTEDERFGEILLFSCFTMRMLGTLNRDPAINEFAKRLNQLKPHNIKNFEPEGYTLVGQRESFGKKVLRNDKRFILKLRFGKDFLRFNSYARGFGFLGLPVYQYAPIAITLLMNKLYKNRHYDDIFSAWLAKSASACGEMFLDGQITARNQYQLAYDATAVGNN